MELTVAHWIYLLGIIVIILTMLFRQNVVVPAIAATFFTAWAFKGDFVGGLQAIFNASLVAAGELFNIFLIIALMTALLNSLKALESDVKMIQPIQKVMVNGHVSFFMIFIVTFAISLFFWPTPAVPLVGALLIPAAIRAGLPAMGSAMAIAIAGQGMALSSDYIIQIAPSLSATSAGVSTSVVADKALILSIISGVVALVLAYLSIRKDIQKPVNADAALKAWEESAVIEAAAAAEEGANPDQSFQNGVTHLPKAKEKWSRLFAVLVPLALLGIVVYMVLAKFSDAVPSIEGGDGAAFIGGIAALLLIFATLSFNTRQFLGNVGDHVIDGFVFAFKAMGVVLPIAGFFFIGNSDFAGRIMSLGEDMQAPAFLFDLVSAGQAFIPENAFFTAFSILIIGMITGLDGSGFSGLPLTGSLSGALGPIVGLDPATLAAIGQMGAIWVGGGALVAWSSLVAVAGFSRVPVLELVRKNFIPVVVGLIVSTIAAVLIW